MGKVFSSFQEAGIKLSATALIEKGQYKTKCPSCGDKHKEKNRKDLSVDVGAKLFNCHSPKCDFKGFISEKSEQKYERPTPLLSDNIFSVESIQYWASRGISQPTLIKAKVVGSKREKNKVAFSYIENGELVFYKFRQEADKKENREKIIYSSKNAEMIFYNLDSIKGKKEVIIVEGEPDALSLIESGLDSKYGIISVPNGANLYGGKLEYLDRGVKHFKDVEKFIIAVDNDEAGKVLENELARRLGKERCVLAKFGQEKDANDYWKTILDKPDKEKLMLDCIENAKSFPIEGVYTVAEMEAELEDIYLGNFALADKVGWEKFDKLCSFPKDYGFAVISGPPNTAKSDFMFNIAVRLAAIHGRKFAILSPETGRPAEVVAALIQIYLGKSLKIGVVNREQFTHAKEWVGRHFLIMDNLKLADMKIETFLEIVRRLVFEHGITDAIGDPFNNFENAFPEGESISNYLNRTLTKIQSFVKTINIHLYLVIHPKAFPLHEQMSIYHLNGGAAWANKADIMIFLRRLYNSEEETARRYEMGLGDNVLVQVKKVKKRKHGRVGEVEMCYGVHTGIFSETDSFRGLQDCTMDIQEKIVKDNASKYAEDDLPF